MYHNVYLVSDGPETLVQTDTLSLYQLDMKWVT